MNDGPSQELVVQFLHRQVAGLGAIIVGFFIVGNWVIAHVATDWVMPGEVMSAGQQALTTAISLRLFSAAIKKYGKLALTAYPAPPNGTPTPEAKA